MMLRSKILNGFVSSISILVLVAFILSCSDDNDAINFSDDTNLRLKSIISYNSTNPDQKFTTFFNYNSDGYLMNTQSNSLGSNVDLNYDTAGRIIQTGNYQFFYDNSGRISTIKNSTLRTSLGQYDSTSVSYTNNKVTSITERFTGDSKKRENTTNVSYNNRQQVNLSTRTSKDMFIDTGQEFVVRRDKESYNYSSKGNIFKIITENDYESIDAPIFETEYSFDNFKNPVQLILKTMQVTESNSLVFLRAISERNYFNVSSLFNYFSNNVVFYDQVPQSSSDSFVHYRFKIDFEYNEFGYPISAVQTQTLVNRNEEYQTFIEWEYEEY